MKWRFYITIILLCLSFYSCIKINSGTVVFYADNNFLTNLNKNKDNVLLICVTEIFSRKSFFSSAFVVNTDGLLATAHHSIDLKGSLKIEVAIKEGQKIIFKQAEWYFSKPEQDIAIIKINHTFKTAVKLRTSKLKSGEFLYSLGYPQFIEFYTLKIADYTPVIGYGNFYKYHYLKTTQKSTSFNAQMSTVYIENGSSGSPILDIKGQVVGLAIQRGKMNEYGYSFIASWHVPVDYLQKILKSLSANKLKKSY